MARLTNTTPQSSTQVVALVKIRALQIRKCGDGTFEITLPGRELDANERKVLTELFPHCQDQVHELLSHEALIDSVVPGPFLPSEDTVPVNGSSEKASW